MAGILRVPRSRGALSGVLLILLGAWGALVPLVGPYFHYAYTPDRTWFLTSGRIWLEIAPGVATVIGGLIVLITRLRPVAMFGAWLAALGGAWFVVGITLSPVWTKGAVSAIGTPASGTVARAAEQIGFFAGLGVVIVFLAAVVIGRLSVVTVRDARLAESRDARLAESRGPGQTIPAGAGSAAADSPDPDSAAVEDPVVYDSTTDDAAAGDSAAGGTSATRAGATPGQ
jgi:hypothetical protein